MFQPIIKEIERITGLRYGDKEETDVAKRTTKKVNSNELDGQEFFAAIAQIEQEKGIKPGYMMEKITQALVSAYRPGP